MKQLISSIVLAVCISFPAHSQTEYKRHIFGEIAPAGHYKPSEIELQYSPILINEEAPKPGSALRKDELRALKKRVKPLPASATKTRKKSTAADPPIVLDSLEGNTYNNSVPNDNSFAINRDGVIVSVKNTNVLIYDTNEDQVLLETTLYLFSRNLHINGNKYDPRVAYDPEADRFIIVFLNGTTWEQSKIVVAFSRTSNPMDGFNLYALEGNPLENETWSDYPHIMLGKEELYITMNTFYNGSTNNSGYVESTIRMLDKQAGYDSLPLTEAYFHDISVSGKNLFNFTGMAGGTELVNEEAYFLSNRNLSLQNDSLFVAKISGHVHDNEAPELEIKTVFTDVPYGLPPDARQRDNHRFDCNDSRIQGGFIENNIIQFVGNTVNSQGFSSFYHGVYDIFRSPDTASLFIIENDSLDFGYPNISYTGKSKQEQEAIITFNHTGSDANAGFSSVFYSNEGIHSDLKILQQGAGYINIISSGGDDEYERWGDYTGSQPAYGEPGTVWASGYNSSSGGTPGTWISKLQSPTANDPPIGDGIIVEGPSGEVEKNNDRGIKVGPNPVREYFNVDFYVSGPDELTFTLTGIHGAATARQVELLKQPVVKGQSTFTFNTASLASGVYYLVISNKAGEILKEEKILKI